MASRKHPTQRYHKRLWEAAAAWSSFQDVLDICDYILNERIQPSAPIHYSLVTAICVLYRRPFKRSRGIESLSVEFDIAVDKFLAKSLASTSEAAQTT